VIWLTEVNIIKHRNMRRAKRLISSYPKGIEVRTCFYNVGMRECSTSGVQDGPKSQIMYQKRNVVSASIRLNGMRQVKPQGTLLDERVHESGESECCFVMKQIRVSMLPGPKGSPIPVGALSRDSLRNLFFGASK
jgi:hypothetical protein